MIMGMKSNEYEWVHRMNVCEFGISHVEISNIDETTKQVLRRSV